jgi:VWFA-related protein
MFRAALLSLLLLPVAGLAEESAQAPIPVGLTDSVEVRVVNVEAVVTDRDGVRVHGLGPDDFRLLVDGEEVPIDYFTEIRGGEALAGAAEGVETAPSVMPGEPLGTNFLIFVDEFFTVPADRRQVLRSLESELDLLGPADRVAVVAWNGRELEMLSTWTDSRAELERILALALERPSYGLQRLAEERQFLLTRNSALLQARRNSPFGSLQLEVDERFYADLLVGQLERASQAAAATLRGFGSPPGRRVMLLLGGSWPYEPVQYVAGSRFRPVVESGIADGREIFAPLAETANLLGYTLYPVDVPGLEAGTGIEASSRSPIVARVDAELGHNREREVHYTFETLARKTGGRALLNGSRGHAFAGAVDDTRSFYWLGFTPEWAGDDERHEIRVELARPDLRVRSRDGFSDLSRSTQLAMAVESAVLFGNPASLDPLEIRIGRAEKSGWGKVEVPLEITIPLDRITVLEGPDGYRASLEIHLAALDSGGAMADIPPIPFAFISEQAPAAGDSISFETRLKMRRADHDLVVAVYDRTGGRMLSGAAEVGL